MKAEEVKSLFTLAGIPVETMWELSNQYLPVCDDYLKLRAEHPWWLVKTPQGLIKIGWRKRVISINWEDTPLRMHVTADDVTKDMTAVHAWSVDDALKYLRVLGEGLRKLPAVRPNRLTVQDENILKDLLKITGDQPAIFAIVAMQQNMDTGALEIALDDIFKKLGNGRVTVQTE